MSADNITGTAVNQTACLKNILTPSAGKKTAAAFAKIGLVMAYRSL